MARCDSETATYKTQKVKEGRQMELREVFVLAVVSASVVTAVISGGFRLLSERWQRTFVLKQRQEDRTDRRLEWMRDQHFVARDEQLAMLVAVIAYIAEQHKAVAEDVVGFIVAFHPEHDERVSTWDEAMAELRRISLLHPSSEVRSKAAAVQRDIQHHWVDPVGDPDMSTFEKWHAELESIAELMHTPPVVSVVEARTEDRRRTFLRRPS